MNTEYGLPNDFYLKIVIREDEIRTSSRTRSQFNLPYDTVRVLPENYQHEFVKD